MKKLLFLASSVVFSLSASVDNIYYQEWKALKRSSESGIIFNEEAHSGLSALQRDIVNFKQLSFSDRILKSIFSVDAVVVTRENMPQLYSYIEAVCQKGGISVPTVYMTRHDNIFNAFAAKIGAGVGAIVIGAKLLKETSAEATEAIVAHELGHIAYKHANKKLVVQLISYVVTDEIVRQLISRLDNSKLARCGMCVVAICMPSIIGGLIVNKRFEKEADEFACKVAGKENGIVEFFELLQNKENITEEEFKQTYEMLENNKGDLSRYDYVNLISGYYVLRAFNRMGQCIKYLYHETFWGDHPSNEARIAAAKKCLCESQQRVDAAERA
jgi:Zn-dependent protease with chaperone function